MLERRVSRFCTICAKIQPLFFFWQSYGKFSPHLPAGLETCDWALLKIFYGKTAFCVVLSGFVEMLWSRQFSAKIENCFVTYVTAPCATTFEWLEMGNSGSSRLQTKKLSFES
jgi:hypothetical protein